MLQDLETKARDALRPVHPKRLRRAFDLARDPGAIAVHWWEGVPNNWGDALNPYLVERLSKRRVVQADNTWVAPGRPVYQVIGSTLGASVRHAHVWGAGFVAADKTLHSAPKQVLAVRGPLSRDILLRQGFACPAVYGDPAILMPILYQPTGTEKRARVGVVPHYVDGGAPWVKAAATHDEVRVISVLSSTESFVDQLVACDVIVSSSLHGIIAAEAYGVPALWVEFSEHVAGAGFKFHDYYAATRREAPAPVRITLDTKVDDLVAHTRTWRPPVALADDLMGSCPFA